MKSAYGDVFGNIGGFLRIIWLMVAISIVFIELPSLLLTNYIFDYIHADKKIEVSVDVPPSISSNVSVAKVETPPAVIEKTVTEIAATEKPPQASAPQPSAMEQAERVKPEHMMMLMALNLIQIAIVVSFLVAWYRQLLFAENKGKTITPHFGKNEWDYTKTVMKSSFVLFPVMMVLMGYGVASIPGFSDGKPEDISQTWPVFVICGGALLYLLASLSMSSPITIMGHTATPIKDSWKMTTSHIVPLILGNLCVFIPAMIVAMVLISGASWLLHLSVQSVPGAMVDDAAQDPFMITLCIKAMGSFFTLVLFALLAAFHARVYAFLVRSKQADTAV
jgi:hypothetical protein